MIAKIKNLHDQIFEPQYKGIVMVCQSCHAEFSAHKGDYWQLPDRYIFKHCGKAMKLARKEIVYRYL